MCPCLSHAKSACLDERGVWEGTAMSLNERRPHRSLKCLFPCLHLSAVQLSWEAVSFSCL